jgi:general secretion pathway protein J
VNLARKAPLGRWAEGAPTEGAVAAFTLLEVMVATVIFAGVMVAIYGTWTSILSSARVAQASAAEVQRSRLAIRTLEEALLGARLPLLASAETRQNQHLYSFLTSDDPDEPYLSFVARLPESFPRSGRFGDMRIRRVTFNLEPDRTGGNQLVLRQVPVLFDPDRDEQENPLVLATDVRSFALEFWDARADEWALEWTATNRVPPLIRVSLETGPPGGGRFEPSRMASRVIPMVASGALTGLRSPAQSPGVEPVNPPPEAPPNDPVPP